MSERKSRFGDRSTVADDPALRVLQMPMRSGTADPSAPVTYPGKLAAEDQQGLVARLKQAREESEGVRTELGAERAQRERDVNEGLLLVQLDPESIGLTDFANRSDLSLSTRDERFKAFKESIRLNGQDTPVRVRPAAQGAPVRYELVEGHRRHAAIRELNRETDGGFKILARIDAKATDLVDLCLKMYRENAEREDLSAFETGMMFANWREAGVCKTQREIAALTALNEATVSQYLSIAALPSEILSAFPDVRDIAMRWSPGLAKACKDHLPETLARAKRILKQNPRPDAEGVYAQLTSGLTAVPKSKKGTKKTSDMVYVDDKVLFKIALKDRHMTFSRWQIEDALVPELYKDMKAFFDEWLRARGKAKS